VLLGEATHGTHEFYEERARITQRLIEEKGFHAVAVEADWPDAYRVNRYVRGQGDDAMPTPPCPASSVSRTGCGATPTSPSFVDWLRGTTKSRQAGGKTGRLLRPRPVQPVHLAARSAGLPRPGRPGGGQVARERYACFDHYYEDSQHYGYSANLDLSASCEEGVIEQLNQMQRRAYEYSQKDGSPDAFFHAQQNARLVKNAEEYYRTMFRGRVSSWNLRDSHMAETLDALAQHLSKDGEPARIVVWEHNSHIGDARATEVGRAGRVERGRTGAQGLRWPDPPDRLLDLRRLCDGGLGMGRPGRAQAGAPRHARQLRGIAARHRHRALPAALREGCGRQPGPRSLMQRRLERAIGVIYLPRTERQSHYFSAQMAVQFDAVIHIDRTTAVTPLDPGGGWHSEEPPETYPGGF
jgi:erythromycin esterase-like protein